MPKVYVINKSGHDFSEAENFGDLCYLSEGSINRYAIARMYREFCGTLNKSQPSDYLLITGLTVMCSIACSIFARLHGRLNLLIFRNGKYVERKLILDDLLERRDK